MRTTRQKFNLILTLAVMLTMAQTAWAANEETVTWTMDGGKSEQTTLSGDYTLINTNGKEIHYSTTGSGIISNNVNRIISFNQRICCIYYFFLSADTANRIDFQEHIICFYSDNFDSLGLLQDA